MLDHLGQINTPATVVMGPVYVSTVVSYLLTYDDADVNDNLVTALSAQIEIRMVL